MNPTESAEPIPVRNGRPHGPPRTRAGLAEAALWLAALALLWALLNPGDRRSWIVGGPGVCLAAYLAWRIRGPMSWGISPGGLVRFVVFFVGQSVAGGWDVARRALHPRLPLNPGLVRHPLRLPAGPSRILFLNVTSLLPGTVSVGLEGDTLVLHVLETGPAVSGELRRLETRVADLFSLDRAMPGEARS